jgi:glycosyltransferase involved in cell wall biosynthesis
MLPVLRAELTSTPDISVVVPVWGDYAGDGLREALESLTRQDLVARIIVVDNASEPPIGELPGAEVLRSETRLTVGAARNLGLAQVTSPYVLFWDADDLMLPGTLRFLHERIAQTPEAVLVAASILEGDPPAPHRWPRRWTYRLTRFRNAWALGDCVWSLFPTTGCALMRTDAARASGYGDANSGEDWVLGVSLAFRGRVLLEPRPGRLYRRHPASLWETQRSSRQLVRHARAVRRRIRQDPAVPRWARLAVPLVTVLQLTAALVLHPVADLVRAIRPSPGSVAVTRH